jgi:hypothetical protein
MDNKQVIYFKIKMIPGWCEPVMKYNTNKLPSSKIIEYIQAFQ